MGAYENAICEEGTRKELIEHFLKARSENATLTAALEEARGALGPFSAKAESDIGSDESDRDLFRPMMQHNEAPHIRVGDLRRARTALATINAALERVE